MDFDFIKSVDLDDENDALVILDQTLLPNEVKFLHLKKIEEIWEAINILKVRGAPAIGIAAGFGIYVSMKNLEIRSVDDFVYKFKMNKEYLASARPTAVNLFWALDRMEDCLMKNLNMSLKDIKIALKNEAIKIMLEDNKVCEAIGENALSLLKKNWGLMTHCNAGPIATSKFGTALAPMYLGKMRGYNFKIFANETRPLLQGARLTAWELLEAGMDVTLLCDNMASSLMSEGKINAVLVGCDRVAANGDTANKIGTSGVAIIAKHYNIPFYVCAPCSTIDMNCKTSKDIHIEHRAASEVTDKWYEKPITLKGVKVYNPAFDITENSLITGIITENGIAYPPFNENLNKIYKKYSEV
jgi:methylthioribose-1-phosphate isomerase